MRDTEKVAADLGGLIVSDLLKKHGIQTGSRRSLSAKEKQEIQSLIKDLQHQVSVFLHQSTTTVQQATKESGTTPVLEKEMKSKRRLVYRPEK